MTAEHRLKELDIALPAPPEPFGTYAEAVQTSNLLFLTGMLPTQGRRAAFIGRVGAELDVDTARKPRSTEASPCFGITWRCSERPSPSIHPTCRCASKIKCACFWTPTYPCSASFTVFRRANSSTSAATSTSSRLEPRQRLTKLRYFRKLGSTRSSRPASKPGATGDLSCAPLRIP
jgi:hypothetical protein